MAVLSATEIYDVALAAGFSPDQAVTWTAIALAQTGGTTDTTGPEGQGLWQIDGALVGSSFGDLSDPSANARAAYALSQHGRNLSLWASEGSGTAQDYRLFLPGVMAAVNGPVSAAASGTAAGTATGYDAIDGGAPLVPGAVSLDSDDDGLTDEFEAMIGTNPLVADTDGDGLTDSLEAVVSHTDPLNPDTDGDSANDAMEWAAGTDAGVGVNVSDNPAVGAAGAGPAGAGQTGATGVLDSDGDGLSDLLEQQLGTNVLAADTDGDGLSDSLEVTLGTDATQLDTDGDGFSDAGEVRYGMNPLVVDSGYGIPVPPPAAPPPEPMPAPVEEAIAPAAGAGTSASSADAVQTMLDAAMAQVGDEYVFGVDTDPDDPDPDVFDCAEFTQWGANQVGIELPGSTFEQYLMLKDMGLLIPVAEAANTPGALLFHFSSEPVPGGGRPSEAHVAFSLGDGTTVEAASEEFGVTNFDVGDRFEYAAVLPGLAEGDYAPMPAADTESATGMSAADTDGDGLADPGTLDVDAVMRGIMQQESGGDYQAENPTSTASGAYQYIDGTWDGYGGYSHASDAPPEIQDEKMRADVQAAYDRLGDWERVIAAHFAGEPGQDGPKTDWDVAPGTPANHNPTIRDYVDGVLGHIAELEPETDLAAAVPPPVDSAEVATAAAVEPAGPVALSAYDAIDAGAPMTNPGVDSDLDGLTDEFEKLIGSNPTLLDSDGDGLTDGYEMMGVHSDPTLVDTDLDGLTDSIEASLGTNATLLDSDFDGVTDAAEVRYGTNPLGTGLDQGIDLDAPAPIDPDESMLVGDATEWH